MQGQDSHSAEDIRLLQRFVRPVHELAVQRLAVLDQNLDPIERYRKILDRLFASARVEWRGCEGELALMVAQLLEVVTLLGRNYLGRMIADLEDIRFKEQFSSNIFSD